ncbi:hypothetical protein [Tolypothrix sp. VBCCA 56010]|uniref:hypothetical protein n=1 Tax=Tolypothrix sp. VBCCA 56010 TaxID=3137731 RepID=UPI003D7C8362
MVKAIAIAPQQSAIAFFQYLRQVFLCGNKSGLKAIAHATSSSLVLAAVFASALSKASLINLPAR